MNPLTEALHAEHQQHAKQVDEAISKRIDDETRHIDLYHKRVAEMIVLLGHKGFTFENAAQGATHIVDEVIQDVIIGLAAMGAQDRPIDINNLRVDPKIKSWALEQHDFISTCEAKYEKLKVIREKQLRDEANGPLERSNPKITKTEPLPQLPHTFSGVLK